MTFLELVQRLRQECGAGGSGPSTVVGQSGEAKRLVDWTASAWLDIQRRHNEWEFMRSAFSVATVANDDTYTAADCSVTNLRNWHLDTFKLYLTSLGVSDECPLIQIPYADWYFVYGTGAQTAARPIHCTVKPDRSIALGPKPDAIYTLSGEYQSSAVTLAADADEPSLPEEYHDIIVYAAMMKYGRYEGAGEVYADGQNQYRRLLRDLERTQLPQVLLGGALA